MGYPPMVLPAPPASGRRFNGRWFRELSGGSLSVASARGLTIAYPEQAHLHTSCNQRLLGCTDVTEGECPTR